MVTTRQDEMSLNIFEDKGFLSIRYRTLLILEHTSYLEKI